MGDEALSTLRISLRDLAIVSLRDDDTVGLFTAHGTLWAHVKTRGTTKPCERCRAPIEPKSHAYSPLTEGGGVVRYMRICESCVVREVRRLVLNAGDETQT